MRFHATFRVTEQEVTPDGLRVIRAAELERVDLCDHDPEEPPILLEAGK